MVGNNSQTEIPQILSILIRLLKTHGLRYSSIQAIQKKHVLESGHILITDVKGGFYFVVYFPDILTIPFFETLQSDEFVFPLSYKQFYLFCKKQGFVLSNKEKYDTDSVTQYFRAIYISNLKKYFSKEFPDIRHVVGHNSKESDEYYLRRTQNGSSNRRYTRRRER